MHIQPSSELDFEELIGRIGQENGFRYAEIWLVDPDSSTLTLEAIWHCVDRQLSLLAKHSQEWGISGTLQELVLKSQKPEWVANFPESDCVDSDWRSWICDAGLQSGLGIPIFEKRNLLGIGVFFASTSNIESEDLARICVRATTVLIQGVSGLRRGGLLPSNPFHREGQEILVHREREGSSRNVAYYDMLTGLPNRLLFHRRLTESLDRSKQANCKLAMFSIDVDRFQAINDSFGHSIGDLLLRQVSQRLKSCIRSDDILARWGEDEFTLLIQNIASEQQVTQVCERILNAFTIPFPCQGYELHITCSIGIAMFPSHAETSIALFQNAEAALYEAKAQGRNTFILYHSAVVARPTDRFLLETQLRNAPISNAPIRDELALQLQPHVDSDGGQLVEAETFPH